MTTSRKRPFFSVRTLLAILVMAVVTLVVVFARGPLASALWGATASVVTVRDAVFDGEAARLRAELASTSALLADRDALYRENLELKARLGRNVGQAALLAGVVVRPPETPYDTLIIDAGESEGVAVGDLVSAGGSMRIGEVEQVFGSTSRVILFSAPGQRYQALLMGDADKSTPLSVEGQGAGSLSAQVPAGTRVREGDLVVFPAVFGGLLARVSHVEAEEGESFITIYMRLPVDLFALRYVEVTHVAR